MQKKYVKILKVFSFMEIKNNVIGKQYTKGMYT